MWGFGGIAALTCDLVTDGGEGHHLLNRRLGCFLWWSGHCVEEKIHLPVPGINV